MVILFFYSGGNLAAAVCLKVIETHADSLYRIPPPIGVLLIYPCLSFDMACWMPPNQLGLIRAESVKSLESLIEAKQHLKRPSPLTMPPAPRRTTNLKNNSKRWYDQIWPFKRKDENLLSPGKSLANALSMTSRMSYFTDRITPPESKSSKKKKSESSYNKF